MSILVSVIVPVYNVERYLKECVDSIMKQTYPYMQIILVDDGSTDNSGVLCDNYAEIDSRITVLHKMNGGLSDARNAGLKIATGKYIYFCDSDDYLTEKAIEELITAAEFQKADCVIFNAYSFVDGDPNKLYYTYVRKKNYQSSEGFQMAYSQLLNDEYKPCACLGFYKKDILSSNNIYFIKDLLHEDEIFSYQIYKVSKRVAYVKDPLYRRRIRPGSIMTSANMEKRFHSMYQIFKIISEDKVKQADESIRNEFIIRIAKSALLDFRLMSQQDKLEYRNENTELVNNIRTNKGYGEVSLVIRTYWWYLGVVLSGMKKVIKKYIKIH